MYDARGHDIEVGLSQVLTLTISTVLVIDKRSYTSPIQGRLL